jgi:hypothetical protein
MPNAQELLWELQGLGGRIGTWRDVHFLEVNASVGYIGSDFLATRMSPLNGTTGRLAGVMRVPKPEDPVSLLCTSTAPRVIRGTPWAQKLLVLRARLTWSTVMAVLARVLMNPGGRLG